MSTAGRRKYRNYLNRQAEYEEQVRTIVAEWSKLTGINVEMIEGISWIPRFVVVRFRELDIRPDGVQHLRCARDLVLPAELLWCHDWKERLFEFVLSSIKIRPAVEADAEGMCWVHWKAVHVTVANDGYYGSRILNEWSPEVDSKRIAKYRDRIKAPADGRVTIVAETCRKILGFAVVIPSQSYINKLYVSPEGKGKQVGNRLLAEMERLALASGCSHLSLRATVNAEGFYLKHGYVHERMIFHQLETGLQVPYVLMSKKL